MNLFRSAAFATVFIMIGQATSAQTIQKTDFSGIKIERKLPKAVSAKTQTSHNSDVITNPSGTAVTYSRSSYAIAPLGDQPMETEDYGFAGVIVTGDNGEVFLKNPFSQFLTGSYLKGTLSDGKITIQLPQHIMTLVDDELGTFELYARMLTIDEEVGDIVEAPEQTLTLSNNDGFWICEDEYILGLTFDDGMWCGFGEMALCYAPIEDEVAQAPENAEFEQWAMTYDGIGHFVDITIDGNKCYMKNFMPTDNGELAPVTGTISDAAIDVASGQYLGVNEDISYLTYLYGGETNRYFDPNYNMDMEQFIPGEGIHFTLSEDGSYTTDNTAYLTPFTDLESEYIWSIASYEKPMLRKNDITTCQPANPSVAAYEYYPQYGFGYAELFIPMLNVDGMLLDSSRLYYNFYMDGQLVTFTPDDYMLLEENITDVPYSFVDAPNDQGDIKVNGATHTIMIFQEGIESVGVQTLYKAIDGEVYKSDIVTSGTTGIQQPDTASVEIASENFTDLAGRQVLNPGKGLYIRTVRYADGSVRNYKEFHR